jgi:hypothetical protein
MKSMTVFEYLNLRTEWEDIVRKFKFPKGEAHRKQHGTIVNMKFFYHHGMSSNRFREGFDRAVEICEEVINAK